MEESVFPVSCIQIFRKLCRQVPNLSTICIYCVSRIPFVAVKMQINGVSAVAPGNDWLTAGPVLVCVCNANDLCSQLLLERVMLHKFIQICLCIYGYGLADQIIDIRLLFIVFR